MIGGWLLWLVDVWLLVMMVLVMVGGFLRHDGAGPLFRWAAAWAAVVTGWLLVCGLAGRVAPVLLWVGLVLPFARWGWRWWTRPVEQWTEDRL